MTGLNALEYRLGFAGGHRYCSDLAAGLSGEYHL